ncbi:TonB-dependent receptor domain-containing protein [Paraflavitalea pollutisoli]|uniref:TonB-dependent receptor domain-containing protein n=1 Tax=Paraflavitalea pollutisoli TaxID=3034143 RepID=UPI0023EC729C|nr:TonB-dependent receptor [Paraflavitalea sp. H1-2-19X]
MKKIGSLLALLVLSISLFAQDGQGRGQRPEGAGASEGRLYGRILDDKTNKGIEAASVRLYLIVKDAMGAPKDSLVGGMLSKANGDFSVEGLSTAARFRLTISAIGFKAIDQEVAFNRKAGNETDLGNFKLEQEANTLDVVTVTATKPALQMGIDRKFFDVDKSLTAAGGTGVDVMKNIPSVNVDVDGNVTLRNNTPQIFVDGRPTILTLDQIPADNIERVELITNPSAAFDASSTGGVINVILKKNKKLGLNGLASLGAGYPDILNGNLTLNLRQNKFNFFVSGNYNQSGGIATSKSFRENRKAGIAQNYFNQVSDADRLRKFGSVRFGVDYFLDNRNTLTLSQNFVNGNDRNDETQSQRYFTLNNDLTQYGDRLANSKNDFNRSNTQLLWEHKFAEAGKKLNADVTFNTGSGSSRSLITNSYFNPDGTVAAPTNVVRNDGGDNSDQLTIQMDYVDPNGDHSKFEAGLRTFINDSRSNFNAFSVANGAETKLPLSNNYKYREMVNAAYGTYSNKLGDFRYQLGLRAEISKFDGELIDSAKKFGYTYPDKIGNLFDALFPSVFITKALSESEDIQINYTRRIRRPNFWQMNPFVDINDPLNLRQGNPALRPQFTNSFEFNYNKTYSSGSFLGVVYYRRTEGDITQFSDTITAAQYEQLNNAAVDPNAIVNTFINANNTNTWGSELTLQQRVGKNFDFTPTVSLQYTKVNALLDKVDLSNEGFNWEAKLIANYRLASKSKILNKLSLQAIGEYESPEILPQGKRKDQLSLDAALRKDFLKGNKGTLTFSVNDVFNSRRWGTIYDTDNFYQDSYRRRNVRSFRVTFTYKFGKSDFNLFKRKGGEGGGMDEGGGDRG